MSRNTTICDDELINQLEELTPEKIAEILFQSMPDDTTHNQLVIVAPEEDHNPGTYIHEILLTILLEGIMKFNNNLENIVLTNIEPDHILALRPWFNSLKFNLTVSKYDKNEENLEKYNHFYSKIILNKMTDYTMHFQIHNLEKNYTFFFNPLYRQNYPENKLENIYSVIFLGDSVFKIVFSHKYS
jgi:hypothetical protein